MKYNNTLEYSDAIAKLVKRNLDLLAAAKKESRELTEDENSEFEKNEEECKELQDEKDELERELQEENPTDNDETKEKENEENRSLNNNTNKSNIRKMETKKYSLMAELRSAMETGKSINLNTRSYTVASEGSDLVETDVYDILEPLRAKLVLAQAGAKYMTGLVGDVQIPVMTGGQVAWKGETAAAGDGSGSFDSVSLSPKRLTAKFPVSLQFLAQDSVDAEGAIRADIINAIADKLEATILGSGAGDTNTPAGLFANYTEDDAEIANFADICDLEATVEAANVYGDCKYIVSPSAKAALRSMIKGTNATGMVMENGAIDGVDALATSNVPAGNLVYGDFKNLVIGAWDNVQLDVCRDSASLANGCVTIVVNAFFDAKVARSAAFACANV